MANIPEKLAQKGLTIGIAPVDAIAPLSGLDVVDRMGTGRLPLPPMAGQLPIVPHAWSEGRAEFRAWPEARFYNPLGTVHGGWSMAMLDTAMAVAAHTTLKVGELYTSLETAVKFIKPIVEQTGELRIIGEVASRGRQVITLTGRVEDLNGKLFAHGTSSCLIMAVPQSA